MARDEWEGIGLRWSRDDERAEKLTREKIKKYQKKKGRGEKKMKRETDGPVPPVAELRRHRWLERRGL